MLSYQNLSLAKGLLADWLRQFYQQRVKVCVLGFGSGGVKVLLPPRQASYINEHWIASIGGGGGSPVATALERADYIMENYRKRCPHTMITLSLLSDGRFTLLPCRPRNADQIVIIDFEQGPVRLGRTLQLAVKWDAHYAIASQLTSPTNL
jgi:magnesium chelatase subunit ChlD-like protein